MTKLRLAIVGAGPAGIYAADILLKAERKFDVSIDLFEQLPAPYGLVRYGVAPDHPRIKGIITALRQVLSKPQVRLLGNVEYGVDVKLEDLREHYDAVVFTTGAEKDRDLDVPGVDLPGSFGGADFVSWFDGHPDVPREWPLEAESIAVVGAGNVGLDVARMLSKTADELLVGVFRRFAGQAQHAGVIFGLGGPCTAALTADRFALERMVSNLVENAVRFTPRGGKVTLAAYAGSDGVVLEMGELRSTFLPQVWDSLPDPADFLRELKRKAGLPRDFWDPSLRLSRYTVEKFR